MIDAPKTTLFNNIDNLNLEFYEGENEIDFEIDDYSFTVTYSLEEDDSDIYNDGEYDTIGKMKLVIISINAYDNLEDEDLNVVVDDDMQKLFNDYYTDRLDDVSDEDGSEFF